MAGRIWRRLMFNLRYLGRPPWDTGVSPPELTQFIESTQPGRALDLGCGTGTNLVTLVNNGWIAVGIDQSGLSVRKARRRLKREGLQADVLQGDVAGNLDVEGQFDLVLDIGCYHSLETNEREHYRENLLHWLSPGGTFLIYAHLKQQADDPHGVDETDLDLLGEKLRLQWRSENDEHRPDGGGGFPALWAQYQRNTEGM